MQLRKAEKICSMVLLSLSLSACSSFPKLHPHVISIKNGMCGEYEVIKQDDACNVIYKFKAWKPISECEGFFAFPATDVNAVTKFQAEQCSKPQVIEVR